MNKLLTQYSKLTDKLRGECETKIKALLKNAKTGITFKESVFLHFISDNINTDLKQIDKEQILHVDVRIDNGGIADTFEYGLEELDASALYELLLALDEKRIQVA
jgi:hypothetical protein